MSAIHVGAPVAGPASGPGRPFANELKSSRNDEKSYPGGRPVTWTPSGRTYHVKVPYRLGSLPSSSASIQGVPIPRSNALASPSAAARLSASRSMPMISRAFRSVASACITASQRRVSVTRTPFGLLRPGTGYHAQSVLSPPIRSTGD